MHREHFTKQAKLADIVAGNRNIILVLPRFNIELGFGEKSIEEVCKAHNVDIDMFLLICKIYAFESYVPEKEELEGIKIEAMLKYLKASHIYYIESRIPHIGRHLEHLAELLPEKDGKLLKRFYKEYQNEVKSHFEFEEEIVFPYITNLAQGVKSDTFTIETFEENHSNIEDKLSDLKSIIIKYLPGGVLQEERISVLFHLFRLSEDLEKHTLIEDKILAPYVELLENEIA